MLATFQLWLPYLLAFSVTLLMACALMPLARRLELVDRPDLRKHHPGPVPLIGGMAMFCGFAFGILTIQRGLHDERALLAGALLLIIIGVLDDFRELSHRVRFAVQILSGLLMTLWGGIILHDLGSLLSADQVLLLGLWAVPFTVFALVGGINALNMADGLDGLAGGLALIALAGMGWIAWQAGATDTFPLLAITTSCVLAFWLLNMRFPWQRSARIFMGDAGSMFLGFLIAWYMVSLSQGANRAMPPVIALYLFALPIMDTIFVMLRRMRAGKSPFNPDRIHLHHLLQMQGLSITASVSTILLLAAALAGAGLYGLALPIPDNLMFLAWVILFCGYFVLCNLGWRRVSKQELKTEGRHLRSLRSHDAA